MSAVGLEDELIRLLSVFVNAGGVGVFITKVVRIPYTSRCSSRDFSHRSPASRSGSNSRTIRDSCTTITRKQEIDTQKPKKN